MSEIPNPKIRFLRFEDYDEGAAGGMGDCTCKCATFAEVAGVPECDNTTIYDTWTGATWEYLIPQFCSPIKEAGWYQRPA